MIAYSDDTKKNFVKDTGKDRMVYRVSQKLSLWHANVIFLLVVVAIVIVVHSSWHIYTHALEKEREREAPGGYS